MIGTLFKKYESATSSFWRDLIETKNPFTAISSAIEGFKEADYSYADLVADMGVDEREQTFSTIAASFAGDPLTYLAIPKVGKWVVGGAGTVMKTGYNVLRGYGGKGFEKVMKTEMGRKISPLYLNVSGVIEGLKPAQYLEETTKTQVYNFIREGMIYENLDKHRVLTKFHTLLKDNIEHIDRDKLYPIILDRANYLLNKEKLNPAEKKVADFMYDFFDQAAVTFKLKGIPHTMLKKNIDILSIQKDNPLYGMFMKKVMTKLEKEKLDFIKDYTPIIYKNIPKIKPIDVKDVINSPSIYVTLPTEFKPFFLNPRIVSGKEKKIIEDPILLFLKYVNDFYIKVYREPSYLLAKMDITKLRNRVLFLEKRDDFLAAGKLKSKVNVLENLLLSVQGKLPGDKLLDKSLRTFQTLIYGGALGGPGSPLKNLSQLQFSYAVIGNHIFKGVKQYFTDEGKKILNKVPHIFTDWRQEFADIYKVAYQTKTSPQKLYNTLGAYKSGEELGTLEKKIVDKLFAEGGLSIQNIVDKSLFLFQKAEHFLRGTTFLGARQKFLDYAKTGKIDEIWKEVRKSYVDEIKTLYKQGHIKLSATKYADDIVGMTQYRYGVLDTPMLIKNTYLRPIMQFMSYPINTAFMISRMMQNDMFENVAKLLAIGVYIINTSRKVGLDMKEFSLFGAMPGGEGGIVAPIPLMLFNINQLMIDPKDEQALYNFRRLSYLYIPWGRFGRKFGYAADTMYNYTKTGEWEIQDEFGRLKRKTSFNETVAYLFDLHTVGATQYRTDLKALKDAKEKYGKIQEKLKKLYSQGKMEEVLELEMETGIRITDKQIENLRWQKNMSSIERAIYHSPRTKLGFKSLLGSNLKIDERGVEELLRKVELSTGK